MLKECPKCPLSEAIHLLQPCSLTIYVCPGVTKASGAMKEDSLKSIQLLSYYNIVEKGRDDECVCLCGRRDQRRVSHGCTSSVAISTATMSGRLDPRRATPREHALCAEW